MWPAGGIMFSICPSVRTVELEEAFSNLPSNFIVNYHTQLTETSGLSICRAYKMGNSSRAHNLRPWNHN